jgi:hypothetical protein
MVRHSIQAAAFHIDHAPPCPGCGKLMRLVRFHPKPDGKTMLQSFGCRACGVTSIEEARDLPNTSCWSQAS